MRVHAEIQLRIISCICTCIHIMQYCRHLFTCDVGVDMEYP